MDHSLAIRKDPERVWDVPGSEAGSRRDRGRVHHRMSFRKRRQLRYAEELLRILEATLGICAVMMMGTGSLWIGKNDPSDSATRTEKPIHRKKYKKVVHLPQTDAPDILPIQTK